MNSSMSPTWLICAIFYLAVTARFIAYPLPTGDAVAGYDYSLPTVAPEGVDLRIRADEIPTYTITYASDLVCGYLSGSVQIPISCENKNRCLWELESFKYLACEIDRETTGMRVLLFCVNDKIDTAYNDKASFCSNRKHHRIGIPPAG